MKNRFSLFYLAVAACVTVAMAGEGDVERLLRECPGLTFSEAAAFLEKNGFPGECTWFDGDGLLPSMARHRVDGTTCIVLFADGKADREGTVPGGDGAVVGRCELASFGQRCSRQFPEDDCRMLRVVHEAPVPWGGDFNPSRLLAAASALQALWEEEAVRLLRCYCESFTADEQRMHGIDPARCLSILRLLYVPRDAEDALPPIDYGLVFPFGRYLEYELLLKRIRREFPLFPLVLVGDVPFTLAEGYLVAGCCPPTVEEYLGLIRK